MMESNKLKELEKKRDSLRAVMRETLDPLNKEINDLRDEIDLEEKKSFLGKCYKFVNSYGSGKKWNIYIKFTEIVEEDLIYLKIEDEPGIKTLSKKTETYGTAKHLRQTRITPELFEEKYQEMLKEMEEKPW